MDFENIRLFRDIAYTRSISRGAKLNEVSQSAASQFIQELERGLEVSLLDRGTRPLTLTDAGRLYADMCRDILRRKEEFDVTLDRLKGVVEGTVRVASIYSVGLSEMSQLEQEFYRRCPEAHMEVDYLRPEKVYDAVVSDQADIGLLSYPEPSKELTVIPWREEEMVVAASPYHPLARHEAIVPSDLAGHEFIGFDEGLPIQREIGRFLRDQGVEVNVTMRFDNLQMIKEAVALGSGISIMPARIMQAEIAQGRLVPISIKAPELFRPLGIIHRKRKRFTRAAQAFLDLLQEHPTPALATVRK